MFLQLTIYPYAKIVFCMSFEKEKQLPIQLEAGEN
jgi:hypothetical protein